MINSAETIKETKVKTLFVGIQDGDSDGMFSWGMDLHAITQEDLQTEGPYSYRPYWVAEVLESDWQSWQQFNGKPTQQYTGRNYGQWEQFWESFTHGPIMNRDQWNEYKKTLIGRV